MGSRSSGEGQPAAVALTPTKLATPHHFVLNSKIRSSLPRTLKREKDIVLDSSKYGKHCQKKQFSQPVFQSPPSQGMPWI